jgi:hypothetical protein
MKHLERKALVETLDPETLGKTDHDKTFRYALLLLIADLADSQDSLAACYRKMLAIQEARNGGGK